MLRGSHLVLGLAELLFDILLCSRSKRREGGTGEAMSAFNATVLHGVRELDGGLAYEKFLPKAWTLSMVE